MTYNEFCTETKTTIKDAIADLNFTAAELNELNEKIKDTRRYTAQHIKGTLIPKRNAAKLRMEERKTEAMNKIQSLCDQQLAELRAANDLNPNDITDDAKLFNVGVTLSTSDLEKIFDRNQGNSTMERLILDYAKQNNLDLHRTHMMPNADEIKYVEGIPYAAKVSLRWYNHPDVYKQIFGDE